MTNRPLCRCRESAPLKACTGKIYDCNGKLLATNEQTYGITLEDSVELTDNPSKNKMILKCIRLIEKNGDSLDLEFPITYKNGKFRFQCKLIC